MDEEREYAYRSNDLPKSWSNFFADVKEQEKFCDLAVHVGSHRFRGHRVILTAAIPYFRDNISDKDKDLVLDEDVEPTALQCLMDFAYTCELKINTKNVNNLLSVACLLGMLEVRDACCDFLAESLLPQMTFTLLELADSLNCAQLMDVIDQYVTENFVRVAATQEFLDFPFDFIKKLVGKEDLLVDSEEKVMEAILKWAKAYPEYRGTQLRELLLDIRMYLLKPGYLKDLAETKIIQMSDSRDIIDDGIMDASGRMKTGKITFPTEPRHYMETTNLDGATGKYSIFRLHSRLVHIIESFDCIKKKRGTQSNLSCDMIGGTVAELNNKMYYFRWGDALQYKSMDGRGQYHLACPKLPRIYAGATSLKYKIYVCGGINGGEHALSDVECLDPDKDEWTPVSSMRIARWGLCAITLAGHIYAIGGRDTTVVHESVERYSLVTDKWTTIAPMASKRCFSSATTLNGKIYVCGGYAHATGHPALSSAEVYDPITNQWNLLEPMKVPRCEFSLLASRGELYAIGGNKSKWQNQYTCEIYDPKTDRWTFGPEFDTDFGNWAAVVM